MDTPSASCKMSTKQRLLKAVVYGIALGSLGLLVNPILGFASLSQKTTSPVRPQSKSKDEQTPLLEVVNWEFAGSPLNMTGTPIPFSALDSEFHRKLEFVRSAQERTFTNSNRSLAHWAKQSLREIERTDCDVLYGMETQQAVVKVLLENSEDDADVIAGWCAMQTSPGMYSMIELDQGSSEVDQAPASELLPVPAATKLLTGRNQTSQVVVEVVNSNRSFEDLISHWEHTGYTVRAFDGTPPSWNVTHPDRAEFVFGVRPLSQLKLGHSVVQIQQLARP